MHLYVLDFSKKPKNLNISISEEKIISELAFSDDDMPPAKCPPLEAFGLQSGQ